MSCLRHEPYGPQLPVWSEFSFLLKGFLIIQVYSIPAPQFYRPPLGTSVSSSTGELNNLTGIPVRNGIGSADLMATGLSQMSTKDWADPWEDVSPGEQGVLR